MSETLGTCLRTARERRGLSLQQIADQSRIKLAYLQAMEEDRFEALPGAVFVHGVLRTYARACGLDGDELVEQFRQLDHQEQDRAPRMISMPLRKEAPLSVRAAPWVVGIGSLMLVASVYYFFGGAASTKPAAPAMSAAPAPAIPAVPMDEAADEAQPDAPPAAEPEKEGAAEEPAPSSGSPLDDTSLPRLLTVEATSDTWLKVTPDGRSDLAREVILRAGNSVRWHAAERFTLSIGNVAGARVAFDGAPVELPAAPSNILTNLRFPDPKRNPSNP